MSKWTKRFVVGCLVAAVLLGLVLQPVGAAVPEVRIDQEPMYKTLLQVISYIKSYYVEDVSLQKVLEGAVRGAMGALDPYSTYFSREELKDFMDSTVSGSFGGVGMYLETRDGYVIVVAPIRGTPADRAGLRPGDRLIEVDGTSIKGWGADKAARIIKGPVGTNVRLKVYKTSGKTEEITLTRALIKPPSVEPMLVENGRIGFVKLSSFNITTAAEFDAYIEMMRREGVKGIVVDMRNNPGGLLQSSIDVLGSIMPKGPALHMIDRSGQLQTINSGTDKPLIPMVIIINEGSASATEIVVGALKDYGTAFVVGKKSFGKGSVQQIIEMGGQDGVKITIAKYLTPNKNKIDGVGITPDQEIPEQWEDPLDAPPVVGNREFKIGEKGNEVAQLERALVALGLVKRASGSFTSVVSKVVAEFQKSKGLNVTGNLDYDTSEKINQELAAKGLGGLDRQAWEAVQILKQKARIF